MTDFWNPYAQLTPQSRRMLGLAAVFGTLLIWSALAASGKISTNKLPAPWKVLSALKYLAWDSSDSAHGGHSLLLTATLYSVGRVAVASVLVMAIGIPAGILMGAAPRINALLSPLVDPFRSAPIVALLPILVMWFGIDELMKIVFLFAGSVVYLVPMVRDAVLAVPQSYWISSRDLGATPFECIWRTVVPMAMPRIADAIILGISVMWTYITVAEYVNAGQGLGQMIQNSERFSAMDQVFAGIIVIIVLALMTYQTMSWIKRKLYSWETLA
jgi:ABC-type nitrate/sulfonate/bicarbonate transport system permease component